MGFAPSGRRRWEHMIDCLMAAQSLTALLQIAERKARALPLRPGPHDRGPRLFGSEVNSEQIKGPGRATKWGFHLVFPRIGASASG